jgi:hypothetical protein
MHRQEKNCSSPPLPAADLFLIAATHDCAVHLPTFGSFVGTVKDSSGALVPGATVTLTNTGNGAERTVQIPGQIPDKFRDGNDPNGNASVYED